MCVSTCTEAMKHSIYRTRGTLRVAAITEIPCEQSRVQGIGLSRGPSIGSSQSASQRGLKFPGGSPRGTASSNVDVLGAHFYSIALLGVTSQPWFCSFFTDTRASLECRERGRPWPLVSLRKPTWIPWNPRGYLRWPSKAASISVRSIYRQLLHVSAS